MFVEFNLLRLPSKASCLRRHIDYEGVKSPAIVHILLFPTSLLSGTLLDININGSV